MFVSFFLLTLLLPLLLPSSSSSFFSFKVLAFAKKEIAASLAASEGKKEKEENAVLAALGADGGISRLKSFELTGGVDRGTSIAERRKLINVNRLFLVLYGTVVPLWCVCCGVLRGVEVWCAGAALCCDVV